jgi:autophagy-related protein 9
MIENRVFDGPEIDPMIHYFYDIIHSTLFFSRTFDWIYDTIIFPTVIPSGYQVATHNMHNIPISSHSHLSIVSSSSLSASNNSLEANNLKIEEILQRSGYQERCITQLNLRLRLVGVLGFFCCPIILIFIIIYTFFRYTEELKNRPENALTSRQWSRYAKYKFRRYNELPNEFEQRCNSAMSAADGYLKQFYSSNTIILSRLVSFVMASLLAILLMIGLINERTIIDKVFLGKSLLFWLTVLGAILTFCRSISPPRYHYFNPWEHMRSLTKTIGLPENWIDVAHDLSIHKQFSHYYPHRIVIFVHEILAVLCMPYFAIFFLPRCSRNIVTFLANHTTIHPHIGPICKLSIPPDHQKEEGKQEE